MNKECIIIPKEDLQNLNATIERLTKENKQLKKRIAQLEANEVY